MSLTSSIVLVANKLDVSCEPSLPSGEFLGLCGFLWFRPYDRGFTLFALLLGCSRIWVLRSRRSREDATATSIRKHPGLRTRLTRLSAAHALPRRLRLRLPTSIAPQHQGCSYSKFRLRTSFRFHTLYFELAPTVVPRGNGRTD